MSKKVMVVGGTGNMSTGIVRELLKKGYDVTIYSRGKSHLKPHPDARVIYGDRHDGTFVSTMRKNHYDIVYDMIGFVRQDAIDDYEAFQDCERFVFCSTGAVATPFTAEKAPITEEDVPDTPSWEYGVTKKACEDYFLMKYHENGFPVTIMRPASTYGRVPGLIRQVGNINGAANVWVDRIRKGKPIVTGNEHIARSFLHADDAANAFVMCLDHEICKGQAYNLVARNAIDWGEYHRAMMHAVGKEVEMVEVTYDTLKSFEGEDTFQMGDMITKSFLWNGLFSAEKLYRDIPEFRQLIDIEKGMEMTLRFLTDFDFIPDSDHFPLEDEIIQVQRRTYIR